MEFLEAQIAPQAIAGVANDNLETPADIIHPDIHQNNNAGDNANPNGNNNPNGSGGNIHGIANVPGQNDDVSAKGGFVDQLATVHGGIGEYNPQVVDAALAEEGV